VPRVDKAPSARHNKNASLYRIRARMAELADALRSGRSSRKGVEVRVLFRAPTFPLLPPVWVPFFCLPELRLLTRPLLLQLSSDHQDQSKFPPLQGSRLRYERQRGRFRHHQFCRDGFPSIGQNRIVRIAGDQIVAPVAHIVGSLLSRAVSAAKSIGPYGLRKALWHSHSLRCAPASAMDSIRPESPLAALVVTRRQPPPAASPRSARLPAFLRV
jgi:hypothetical protein